MKENEELVKQGFYEKIAELLEVQNNYKPFPYPYRTRWNNRTGGNGRFNGHGLVRMFAPNLIHVALNNPKINGTFDNMDEVYETIRQATC